jgi:ABC-type uncharacterized transport system permease subunit
MTKLADLHLLMSLCVVGIYLIVAVQALLLALQDHLLRARPAAGIVKTLPPLEAMELWLFRLLLLGFIFLSLIIVSGVVLFHAKHTARLVQHGLLAVVCWAVFAALLLGQQLLGWRGQTAIRWTLSGLVLLLLCYWGSRFLS